MNARDELAAAVAEGGPFPMPVGEPMPVELTEQQLEALIDAGNRALNDHYHEDQCHCDAWPTSCVSSGNYFMGAWDTNAFAIGLPAVLGVWESLRNDRHAAKIAELRADNERLRAEIAERNRGVQLINDEAVRRAAYEAMDAERRAAESRRAVDMKLNAELRARVAELEAQAEKTAAFCAQRAEYVTNLRQFVEGGEHDYYRWTGHAEARRQLSQSLGLPVAWPPEDMVAGNVAPQVAKLRTMLAPSVEDPHDSPRHHTYELGRDLPTGGGS